MSDVESFFILFAIGAIAAVISLVIIAIAHPIARHMPKAPVIEFLPPPGDIITHGLAVRADRRVVTAVIMQLAVAGKIRVLAPRGTHGPVAIEALPGTGLSADDHFFLQALRPRKMNKRRTRRYLAALREIGISVTRIEDAPDITFLRGRGAFRGFQQRSIAEHLDRARTRAKTAGLARRFSGSVHLYLLSLLFLVSTIATLLFALGAVLNGVTWGALGAPVGIAAMFWVLALAPPPIMRFTPEGHALRVRLSGLRDYMRLAEQDRMRVLQSPQGALRTPAGALTPGGQALGLRPAPTAGDPVAQSELDRFVLIERLLPYAVLFRQEREWQRELEHLGGTVEFSQNMRVLGSTLEGLMAILQVLSAIGQVLRAVGAVFSLFART
ncbi:MAG: DUF2207 family protein [Microbacterium gubbeenense]